MKKFIWALIDHAVTEATTIIEGGELQISDYSNTMDFGKIRFDGNQKLLSSNGSISIEDLTGTFAGWNLQVNNELSETWDEAMVIRMAFDTTGVELNAENQVFFFQDAGKYDALKTIDFGSSLLIPGSVLPGAYSTNITWTLSQGPEI